MNTAPSPITDRVQTLLESLYGIGIPQRVGNYLINFSELKRFFPDDNHNEKPHELFLVREQGENSVEIALFLDKKLLFNLEENNPFASLNEKNLSDFCILTEGVSHFVYFLWKAHKQIPITRLELELQAEIDKFLILLCYMRSSGNCGFPQGLFEALFEDFRLINKLSGESQGRYLTASSLASKYCHRLKKNFRHTVCIREFLSEIRAFYNFSQEQKIRHIVH